MVHNEKEAEAPSYKTLLLEKIANGAPPDLLELNDAFYSSGNKFYKQEEKIYLK